VRDSDTDMDTEAVAEAEDVGDGAGVEDGMRSA
jgi:hypothetical protein